MDTSMFKYRPIDLSEWDQIKPLLEELHLEHHDLRPDVYTPTVDLRREQFNNSIFGYGCFREGKLIGLCWGYLMTKGRVGVVGFVEDFIVSEPYRSVGVGKRLFEEFGAQCRQQGATAVELITTSVNEKAIAFYKAQGMGMLNYQLRLEWR